MALPHRAYDPLYDTTYTVSGARDHYRQQTMAGGFALERAPNYPNMFSELPHHPASGYRMKNSDKVPAFVDRGFQPAQANPLENTLHSQPTMVAGQQRFKYFRRPLLAAPEPAMIRHAPPEPAPPPPLILPEPKTKTIGTQSDYREQEAQTMPWEPPARLPDAPSDKQAYLSAKHNCEGPELLLLKDLKFGDGLPPGLQEVRRIEKLREKRAFEATLPPLHDMERLPLRQKMIEEWEGREWEEREAEIHGVQAERLGLIDQALQVREEEFEMEAAERVAARKTARLEEKASRFAAIQARRIKTMRQLIEARKYVEKHRKLVKPTVVERYAHFGSAVYAPMAREGRFPESKPNGRAIETEGFQPVAMQGIAELEAFLPKKLLNLRVAKPQKPTKLSYKERKEAVIQRDLKTINDLLDTAKATKGRGFGECWPAPLKDTDPVVHTLLGAGLGGLMGATEKGGHDVTSGDKSAALRASTAVSAAVSARRKAVARLLDRPDTPELPPSAALVTAGGGDRDAAATLLQRLLRGRAAQNIMFEGKTRRADLIAELRLEGSEAAASGRPEDRAPAVLRIDALLGTAIARLAAALAVRDEGRRAAALAAALAPWDGAEDIDRGALLAATPPRTPPTAVATSAGGIAIPLPPSSRPQSALQAAPASGAEAQVVAGDYPAAPQGGAVGVEIDPEVAAAKIQAAFKGHKARKEVAAMRARGGEIKADAVAAAAAVAAEGGEPGVEAAAAAGVEPGATKAKKIKPPMQPVEVKAEEQYSPEEVDAVKRIQAVQRGRIARKRVAGLRGTAGASPSGAADAGAGVGTDAEAPAAASPEEEGAAADAATGGVAMIDGVPVTPDMEAKVVRIQALQRKRKAQRRVAEMRAQKLQGLQQPGREANAGPVVAGGTVHEAEALPFVELQQAAAEGGAAAAPDEAAPVAGGEEAEGVAAVREGGADAAAAAPAAAGDDQAAGGEDGAADASAAVAEGAEDAAPAAEPAAAAAAATAGEAGSEEAAAAPTEPAAPAAEVAAAAAEAGAPPAEPAPAAGGEVVAAEQAAAPAEEEAAVDAGAEATAPSGQAGDEEPAVAAVATDEAPAPTEEASAARGEEEAAGASGEQPVAEVSLGGEPSMGHMAQPQVEEGEHLGAEPSLGAALGAAGTDDEGEAGGTAAVPAATSAEGAGEEHTVDLDPAAGAPQPPAAPVVEEASTGGEEAPAS